MRKHLIKKSVKKSHIIDGINSFDELLGSLMRGLGEKNQLTNKKLKQAKGVFAGEDVESFDELIFSCNREVS